MSPEREIKGVLPPKKVTVLQSQYTEFYLKARKYDKIVKKVKEMFEIE